MSDAAAIAPVRGFAELRRADTAFAGGKGANLGELTAAGLPVPPGFVVGAPAYAEFCGAGLRQRIAGRLDGVDVEDTAALERAAVEVREMVEREPLPPPLAQAVRDAYLELAGADPEAPVAVRSSATAEDTESASFAGMNETLLNVRGADAVLAAVRRCWSSLFGARTVYYRAERGFEQAGMDIAVVVQRQIESSRAGVMFTIDPASGDRDRLVIEGAFGLGESVVSGAVSPDRYVVAKRGLVIERREVRRKELAIESLPGGGTRTRELHGEDAELPVLDDEEVRRIADLGGRDRDQHYDSPQDTEWAFDADGVLWMLQSRPITTPPPRPSAGRQRRRAGPAARPRRRPRRRQRRRAGDRRPRRGGGLSEGEVLVTRMTAPDWVPLMRRAAAIVTDSGGMTCHAAIVSRELGIPCLVGTGEGTSVLSDGEIVSVDAGAGTVSAGGLSAAVEHPGAGAAENEGEAPPTATKILVNLSEPSQLERTAALAVDGVGLLRAELMVVEALDGVHPRALLERGEGERFVERMTAGLLSFAAAFEPRPVTYRTIDFRSNEFRGLEGGERFEPVEANPMIGYRGALRYVHEPDLFGLELEALTRVWEAGHAEPARDAPVRPHPVGSERLPAADRAGWAAARQGFELWVMAEVPSVLFHLAALRRAGRRGHLDRLQRPDPAAARRRP